MTSVVDPMRTIRLAESDEDVLACYAILAELRTHLDRAEFLRRVRLQRSEGYSLAFVREQGEVRSVAGFRVLQNLFSGRVLYVDDLVTGAAHRSSGHGAALMHWLVDHARSQRCDTLELDSGVQRFDAHRFYLGLRMEISSHHFRLSLRESVG
jgi:GNAT superfamily N-acetyltransferase